MNPFKFLRERDIDLLLVEEFYSSESFRHWFLENTIGTRLFPNQFCSVWHSVIHNETGESDLEVDFLDADGKRWRVLIENKINAEFQPKQGSRYIERGEAYVKDEACNMFRTIVIAPEKYLSNHSECKDFDFRLAYEKLHGWFGNASDIGERGIFKQKMIEAAIEQQHLGYQPQFNEVATQNWQLYYQWVQEIASELGMLEPKQSKTSGTFIGVKPPKVFPDSLEIIHKTENGYVDLQFPGKAKLESDWEAFKRRFNNLLESDMTIVKAGNSAAIRLFVPAIDITKDFCEQKVFVVEGIWAAKKLLHWARQHYSAA